MLTIQSLTKTYGSSDHQVTAIDDISLSVADGEFAAIIGRSGSGKSTLLTVLGTLDTPTSGNIKIGEQDLSTLRAGSLVDFRCKHIGFVFQGFNLIPNLTAFENVLLPMEFAGLHRGERATRAAELLSDVGLDTDKQGRLPSKLSGGEQQRVAIARALANHPKLLLADEPTGNLDSETSDRIIELLHQLSRSQNTTVIIVTHDLEIARKADRTFRLADGKLLIAD